MTSVTLNWVAVGEDPYEKTLPVDIETNKNIGALKKAIKDDIGGSVLAKDLKLFKVDITLGSARDEDVVAMLKTGELSIGRELNNNLEKISDCFSTQPADTDLHILVQLPTVAIDIVEQPVAGPPLKSITNAISEAKRLFDQYSLELENVAKNKYEPYLYFKASETNSCKKFIDEKNIPVVNGEPSLLLHNLPEQGEEGLTDYVSFETHIKQILANSDKTVILGTSGCGKTRLCFETLCHNYGLYLISYPYSVGSMDLEESARWTSYNIENKQPKEAERIAERAVMSCIVGRLLLLQHLFNVAEQHKIIMAPKSWLILQLNHTIIRELCIIFREVTFDDIRSCCDSTMKAIKGNLMKIFPIVYDEAQSHTTYLPATFPSARLNQDKARSFFSVVVRSLSSLCYSFIGVVVCITGSGLSLLLAKDEISSRAKEESHVPIFNQFGRIETSDELIKLATKIFPLKEVYALSAIKWLKGRYRWSWAWIHYLIKSDDFDPEEQLKNLVENLTTSADSLANKQYSIYSGFAELEKYPSERPVYIKSVATLELVKRAILVYAMTGSPLTFTSTDEMDIMNLGFAHTKIVQKYTSVIDEPLVIQTGFNFFERDSNNIWFQLMSQVNFNASMPGLIWEKCVVNFLRKELFESNMALSESEMFRIKMKKGKKEETIDYSSYLPEDFQRPPQLLPYGYKCMIGRIAVESTTADNYLEWLRAVAEWEKTGNVPKDFCPICYPPNTAGPDISIAFCFPGAANEERKSYILNVQVKLRKKANITGSFRSLEPELMFVEKNGKQNPPEANDKLCEIYEEQNWFDRNMKMIVVFPCNLRNKIRYQKEITNSTTKQVIIPRVIISGENASILFPEECQEWIKTFKEKNPEDWDCSDIEDE